jgi:hypothetical protein
MVLRAKLLDWKENGVGQRDLFSRKMFKGVVPSSSLRVCMCVRAYVIVRVREEFKRTIFDRRVLVWGSKILTVLWMLQNMLTKT